MDFSPGSKEPTPVLLELIEDNPYQSRVVYDESQLSALAASIQEIGLLQVPVARKVGNKYQMAFGHRRKRAFELLYRTEWAAIVSRDMPLIVLDLSDREMFEVSLTENLKRADLSPIEKAEALKCYMNKFGATSAEAARLFGIPEGTIRGTVRLLNLPEEAKQQLKAGRITQRQARKILEKPETALKRLEPKDGVFDLREKLMILVYDRYRSDVSDQLLFKRIQAVFEENKQLQRQVDLMNERRRQGSKVIPPARRLSPAVSRR
jgi:ParB/RepB/Spo0J family partition protein